jgi:hypothetical protein
VRSDFGCSGSMLAGHCKGASNCSFVCVPRSSLVRRVHHHPVPLRRLLSSSSSRFNSRARSYSRAHPSRVETRRLKAPAHARSKESDLQDRARLLVLLLQGSTIRAVLRRASCCAQRAGGRGGGAAKCARQQEKNVAERHHVAWWLVGAPWAACDGCWMAEEPSHQLMMRLFCLWYRSGTVPPTPPFTQRKVAPKQNDHNRATAGAGGNAAKRSQAYSTGPQHFLTNARSPRQASQLHNYQRVYSNETTEEPT